MKQLLVLISYDINTEKKEGKTRLRKVAKLCVKHGQRVQNSVFECALDNAQYILLKDRLLENIDFEKDSLRLYNLGNNYKGRIEHFGAKPGYDAEAPLLV